MQLQWHFFPRQFWLGKGTGGAKGSLTMVGHRRISRSMFCLRYTKAMLLKQAAFFLNYTLAWKGDMPRSTRYLFLQYTSTWLNNSYPGQDLHDKCIFPKMCRPLLLPLISIPAQDSPPSPPHSSYSLFPAMERQTKQGGRQLWPSVTNLMAGPTCN